MDSARKQKVLYLSHAPDEVYAVIRSAAGPDVDLVTLERDSDDERKAEIADAEVVIVAAYRFSAPLIEAARRLRFVQHQGVGYQDTIDLRALARKRARLAITPAGTTIGVAEHAVLLALAVLRRLTFLDAELRQGRWHVNTLRSEARELYGKTVGYIGMAASARRPRSAFALSARRGCTTTEPSISQPNERKPWASGAPGSMSSLRALTSSRCTCRSPRRQSM